MKGREVAQLLRSTLELKTGRVITFPAGTPVETVLDEILGKSSGMGRRLSDREIRILEAEPLTISGVGFSNAEAARNAIAKFAEIYSEHEFEDDVEVAMLLEDIPAA